jgi:hypothetical protein
MKKILLALLLLTGAFTQTRGATATHYQDGKIVHPATAMTNDQATAIINKMRGKANDAQKVATIKEELTALQATGPTGITTDQVMMLLNQLNEDPKLEAAIYAFQYTVDYKKYQKIQDVFNTEINKRRLQDYVDKHRK